MLRSAAFDPELPGFVGTGQIAREYASSCQGLWWNTPGGTKAGWALALSQQGDTLYAAWLTYDTTGRAGWLSVAAGRTGEVRYAGTLYQMRDPAFGATAFDPARVREAPVGR